MEIGITFGIAVIKRDRSDSRGCTCTKGYAGATGESCADVKTRARHYDKEEKARICACGNFQEKKPTNLLYTANTDASSIRIVLAEAAQRPD